MCHLADLGKVVFGVTAEHGEFQDSEFELPTYIEVMQREKLCSLPQFLILAYPESEMP